MPDASVLVTGARGYIGAALCDRLGRLGYDVRGVDDESAPAAPRPPVTYDVADVTDAHAVQTHVTDVDAVVHLAAISDPSACAEAPEDAWEINAEATEGIAIDCNETGTPLVFASTRAVEARPDSVYAQTKLVAEAGVRGFARHRGGFPARILRLPNVFGEYDLGGETVTKATVRNHFRTLAREGEALTVHAPGTQTREFVHVEDGVDHYHAALDDVLTAEAGAETVRVESEPERIVDVALAIAREHDVGIRVVEPKH